MKADWRHPFVRFTVVLFLIFLTGLPPVFAGTLVEVESGALKVMTARQTRSLGPRESVVIGRRGDVYQEGTRVVKSLSKPVTRIVVTSGRLEVDGKPVSPGEFMIGRSNTSTVLPLSPEFLEEFKRWIPAFSTEPGFGAESGAGREIRSGMKRALEIIRGLNPRDALSMLAPGARIAGLRGNEFLNTVASVRSMVKQIDVSYKHYGLREVDFNRVRGDLIFSLELVTVIPGAQPTVVSGTGSIDWEYSNEKWLIKNLELRSYNASDTLLPAPFLEIRDIFRTKRSR